MSTPTQAIAKLRRIAVALPVHIATAFNPEHYLASAQDGARAILENCDLLTDEEKEVDVPIIVENITVENGPVVHSLIFKIGGVSIYATQYDAVNVITNPDIMPDKIVEWVRLGKDGDPMGKRLDSRDRNKDGSWQSDEQIAQRVFFAVKRRPQDFFGVDEEGRKSLDPTGLPQFAGITKIMSPENLQAALLLVVRVLREHLIATIPGSVLWRIQTAIETEIPA